MFAYLFKNKGVKKKLCVNIINDPYLSEERVYERLKREFKKYGKLIIAYDFDYTINSYKNEPWDYPEVVNFKRWEILGILYYTASPKNDMRNKQK